MVHLFGFIFAITMIKVCFGLLDMDARYYYDDIALIVVVGGTICAAVITFPMSDLFKMTKAFFRIVRKTPEEKESTVKDLVSLAQAVNVSKAALLKEIERPDINLFLKDGIDLILAGFSRDEVESIMKERIYRDREREEHYGSLLRTISKYPPAFGLVGTVLGLVALMRSVSEGADAKQIGLKMALALVATLYGLLMTNILLVPMSENLFNKSEHNKSNRELIIDGILMIYDKKSPLMVQEFLNSYLPPLKRKDYLGIGKAPGGQAA
ncbi:MAG: MotA/TolQ/ExbB proton channel family protein [Bdellovibrionales bacterium]|nr:MotA/TolQ/ExbB proton channel family protein [Bdellovibrionales bacterium]